MSSFIDEIMLTMALIRTHRVTLLCMHVSYNQTAQHIIDLLRHRLNFSTTLWMIWYKSMSRKTGRVRQRIRIFLTAMIRLFRNSSFCETQKSTVVKAIQFQQENIRKRSRKRVQHFTKQCGEISQVWWTKAIIFVYNLFRIPKTKNH